MTQILLNVVKDGDKNKPLSQYQLAEFGSDLKSFLSHPKIHLSGFELHLQVKSPGKSPSDEVFYQDRAESSDAKSVISTISALVHHGALGKDVTLSFQGMGHKESLAWLGLAPEIKKAAPGMEM